MRSNGLGVKVTVEAVPYTLSSEQVAAGMS
jgi:hypothetical protein